MKIFDNSDNLQAADQSAGIILQGCFLISAFTTTVTASSWIAELLLPYVEKFTAADPLILQTICFVGTIYFFYKVEAFIGNSAHAAFTEFAGWVATFSHQFRAYSGLRKAGLIFRFAIFVGAALFSLFTSLGGAQKGAAAVMVNTKIDDFEDLPQKRAKGIEDATKIQREAIEALKAERAAAVAKAEASIDKGTLRAARHGDELAKKEIAYRTTAAEKQYKSKIEKAQAELDKQVQAASKSQDGIDELAKKKAELQLRGVEDKSTSLGWLATLVGVMPLAISVCIKGSIAMSEVAQAANSPDGRATPVGSTQGKQAGGNSSSARPFA